MTPKELREAGIKLNDNVPYGWKTALARRLGLSPRTVHFWASGEVGIKEVNAIAIKALLRESRL